MRLSNNWFRTNMEERIEIVNKQSSAETFKRNRKKTSAKQGKSFSLLFHLYLLSEYLSLKKLCVAFIFVRNFLKSNFLPFCWRNVEFFHEST